MRYRIKPFAVDAIQWDRTDATAARIVELIGADRFEPPDPAADAGNDGFAAGVLTDPHSSWREVYTGQWVIRREDGYVFVLGDDQFRDAYEAVRAEPEILDSDLHVEVATNVTGDRVASVKVLHRPSGFVGVVVNPASELAGKSMAIEAIRRQLAEAAP